MRLPNHPLVAVLLPAVLGLGGAAFSIRGFADYGWSLFIALPILVSFFASFLWSFRRQKLFGSSYWISVLSLLALSAMILVFALDGLICILMALPLALLLALIGTAIGRTAGSSLKLPSGTALFVILCLSFPLLVGFERRICPSRSVREVSTEVNIEASMEDTWDVVVAFPEIVAPPKGIFQLGVAYPISARIDGSGIGAIRYCTFSTGSFVEPITSWNRPEVLAFDVVDNPPPMRELSIYQELKAPHLRGYLISERGEFRLTSSDRGISLKGTTWYKQSLSPGIYWNAISDEIIHRVHRRVLDHIKNIAENGDNQAIEDNSA